MKTIFRKEDPALTLLELIIVIIIINVMSVLAFTQYSKFFGIRRRERVEHNMKAIYSCMQIHKIKTAYYPENDCDSLECINSLLENYGCDIPDETSEVKYDYLSEDLEVVAKDTRYKYTLTLYLDAPIDPLSNPYYHDDNPGAGS